VSQPLAGPLTDEQLFAIDHWRANFHPDALKWFEDGVKAFDAYVKKGSGNAAQLSGMRALLEMAQKLAVTE
jgi:hypothetical protein